MEYIYVIRVGEFCKIGHSRTPVKRLNTISTCSAIVPELVATNETGHGCDFEKEIHQIFEDQRVRGEWFKLSNEDIEFIKNGCLF